MEVRIDNLRYNPSIEDLLERMIDSSDGRTVAEIECEIKYAGQLFRVRVDRKSGELKGG
jgi:hypothetical protein